MSHGAISVFTATMASAGTLTGAINLGRAWRNAYVEIPTSVSGADGTDVKLYASADNSTFRPVYTRINSSTVAANVWQVKSSVSQAIVDLPPGLRYLKFQHTTAFTDTSLVYRVICSD